MASKWRKAFKDVPAGRAKPVVKSTARRVGLASNQLLAPDSRIAVNAPSSETESGLDTGEKAAVATQAVESSGVSESTDELSSLESAHKDATAALEEHVKTHGKDIRTGRQLHGQNPVRYGHLKSVPYVVARKNADTGESEWHPIEESVVNERSELRAKRDNLGKQIKSLQGKRQRSVQQAVSTAVSTQDASKRLSTKHAAKTALGDDQKYDEHVANMVAAAARGDSASLQEADLHKAQAQLHDHVYGITSLPEYEGKPRVCPTQGCHGTYKVDIDAGPDEPSPETCSDCEAYEAENGIGTAEQRIKRRTAVTFTPKSETISGQTDKQKENQGDSSFLTWNEKGELVSKRYTKGKGRSFSKSSIDKRAKDEGTLGGEVDLRSPVEDDWDSLQGPSEEDLQSIEEEPKEDAPSRRKTAFDAGTQGI